MKKVLKTALCLTLALFMFASCKGDENPASSDVASESQNLTGDYLLQEKGDPNMLQFSPIGENDTIAVMSTSLGTIVIRLFPDQAPKTVMNFINLAGDGYYDNTIFHRVIQDFMIQGGDPTGTGYGGESIWGGKFEDEFSNKLYNFYGALCMVNAGANTNGSQFYIVQEKAYDEATARPYVNTGWHTEEAKEQYKKVGGCFWLDGKHTVFGQVIYGMDVVEKIASVEVDSSSKPFQDVKVDTIEVTTYGEYNK